LIREDEENTLKKTNDTLVNNQIESVNQATRIKIDKANGTIGKLREQGKSESDPIVRLHKGRIRNLDISREQKVAELDKKRAVSVGFNHVAGGFVMIEN